MAGEPATLLRLFRALWAALGRLLSTIGMPYTGIGIVGMVVGILLSPNEAPKEFYSAVAGVVPVLLLTLAVQARFFELPTAAQFRALWSPPEPTPEETPEQYWVRFLENRDARERLVGRLVVGLTLLVVLVIGEFAALHPLATGRANDGNPEAVYVALTTGIAMIGALAVFGGVEARMDRQP